MCKDDVSKDLKEMKEGESGGSAQCTQDPLSPFPVVRELQGTEWRRTTYLDVSYCQYSIYLLSGSFKRLNKGE